MKSQCEVMDQPIRALVQCTYPNQQMSNRNGRGSTKNEIEKHGRMNIVIMVNITINNINQ